jgi:SAM-dependent methyltransferase
VDSEEWDRRYAAAELVWSARPNRFLVAEAEGLAPGRALDLACGEGRHAVWLAGLGWRVTGVDFSAVAIAKARELARAREVSVEWAVADLTEYEPEARAFDLVCTFYLQLAPAERSTVVARAAAAVAAGGLFLLVGHDLRNLEHGVGGPRDPRVLYTPGDVVADLAGSGLLIERAAAVERPVAGDAGGRSAIDALVRARRPR